MYNIQTGTFILTEVRELHLDPVLLKSQIMRAWKWENCAHKVSMLWMIFKEIYIFVQIMPKECIICNDINNM